MVNFYLCESFNITKSCGVLIFVETVLFLYENLNIQVNLTD